jgi:hypothetical protein
MSFFNCCCGDSSEKVQATFQPNNERVAYVNYTGQEAQESPDFKRMDQVGQGQNYAEKTASADQSRASADPLPPPPPGAAAMEASDATSKATSQASSKKSSRDRDKAEEKAKLQERVQSFAKRATKGINCQMGNSETNEWRAMTYLLGKGLKEFIVRQQGRPDAAYPIADIMDILRVEDDENIRQTALAQTLTHEEQKRLLLVQCAGKELYLLETNVEDAEIFFSSMRVLRLYCQQQSQKGST